MLNDDPSASSYHEQFVNAAILAVVVGLAILWVIWLRHRVNRWIGAALLALAVLVVSTR
jgi:Ca2+/Na+ antiporter